MRISSIYWLSMVLIFLDFGCQKNGQAGMEDTIVSEADITIAFGSCSRQDEEQILWDDIIEDEPDLWIWLGDNIYGDSENMDILRSKYEMQKSNTSYLELKSQTEIFGIWDDHDYGVNNGGNEYEFKSASRDLLFEFLDVPKGNHAWSREGAYQSYEIEKEDIKIKLILLDSRYFRDEPIKSGNGYLPNFEGSILGDAQWNWLSNELKESQADVHLIGNGIQVISEEHRFEKWSNFPLERQKLFDLLSSLDVKNAILLSGDRHLSELSKIEIEGLDYPLYDITSSGLTHSYTSYTGEPNTHRVGEVITQKSYGVIEIEKTTKMKVKLKFKGDNNLLYMEHSLF